MTTITITEDAKTAATGLPSGAPVTPSFTVTLAGGDHLVFKRNVDPEKHRAALRAILEGLKNRVRTPGVETASETIKALREERGG